MKNIIISRKKKGNKITEVYLVINRSPSKKVVSKANFFCSLFKYRKKESMLAKDRFQRSESGFTILEIPKRIGDNKIKEAVKAAIQSFSVTFLISQKRNKQKSPLKIKSGSLKMKFKRKVSPGLYMLICFSSFSIYKSGCGSQKSPKPEI